MQEALYAETLSYVAARFDSLLASFGEPPGEADAVWIMEDFRWGDPIFVLVSADDSQSSPSPISQRMRVGGWRRYCATRFAMVVGFCPWCCNTVPKRWSRRSSHPWHHLGGRARRRVDSALENLSACTLPTAGSPPDHPPVAGGMRAERASFSTCRACGFDADSLFPRSACQPSRARTASGWRRGPSQG